MFQCRLFLEITCDHGNRHKSIRYVGMVCSKILRSKGPGGGEWGGGGAVGVKDAFLYKLYLHLSFLSRSSFIMHTFPSRLVPHT